MRRACGGKRFTPLGLQDSLRIMRFALGLLRPQAQVELGAADRQADSFLNGWVVACLLACLLRWSFGLVTGDVNMLAVVIS